MNIAEAAEILNKLEDEKRAMCDKLMGVFGEEYEDLNGKNILLLMAVCYELLGFASIKLSLGLRDKDFADHVQSLLIDENRELIHQFRLAKGNTIWQK